MPGFDALKATETSLIVPAANVNTVVATSVFTAPAGQSPQASPSASQPASSDNAVPEAAAVHAFHGMPALPEVPAVQSPDVDLSLQPAHASTAESACEAASASASNADHPVETVLNGSFLTGHGDAQALPPPFQRSDAEAIQPDDTKHVMLSPLASQPIEARLVDHCTDSTSAVPVAHPHADTAGPTQHAGAVQMGTLKDRLTAPATQLVDAMLPAPATCVVQPPAIVSASMGQQPVPSVAATPVTQPAQVVLDSTIPTGGWDAQALPDV